MNIEQILPIVQQLHHHEKIALIHQLINLIDEENRQFTGENKTQHTKEPSLVEAIRRHIEPIGGVDMELPKREPMRQPIDLS